MTCLLPKVATLTLYDLLATLTLYHLFIPTVAKLTLYDLFTPTVATLTLYDLFTPKVATLTYEYPHPERKVTTSGVQLRINNSIHHGNEYNKKYHIKKRQPGTGNLQV